MDHVVYVDAKAKELILLKEGSKRMIIRGAAGRKIPYGRVFDGDDLYFIENNGEGVVRAKARVRSVFQSEKMSEEVSIALIVKNQTELRLTDAQFKRWAGKKYLVLIEIENFSMINPFTINKSGFSNMDDWLPVDDINKVRE